MKNEPSETLHGGKPFIYKRMWSKYKDFEYFVKAHCEQHVSPLPSDPSQYEDKTDEEISNLVEQECLWGYLPKSERCKRQGSSSRI